MIKNISNLGDAALYCDFGNEVSREVNSLVIKYFRNIKNKDIYFYFFTTLLKVHFKEK